MKTTLIPARGTVEFIVYSLDDPEPDISIDGPSSWLRPVVGLIEKNWTTDNDGLPYELVVVDEIGELCTVYDYRNQVMGGDHWDHCSHFYQPHIEGPVGDAPRIRGLSPRVTARNPVAHNPTQEGYSSMLNPIPDMPAPDMPPDLYGVDAVLRALDDAEDQLSWIGGQLLGVATVHSADALGMTVEQYMTSDEPPNDCPGDVADQLADVLYHRLCEHITGAAASAAALALYLGVQEDSPSVTA